MSHISTMAQKTSSKKASVAAGDGDKPPSKKPPSPPRKKKTTPTPRKTVQKGELLPTLSVTRFPAPISCEMYIYTLKTGNDGYLNGLQVALAGSTSDVLTEGNFHSVPYRRMPNSANEHAVNGNDFWRNVILRYPPQQDSTPET